MNAPLIERRRFLQGAALAGTTAVAVPSVLADQVAAAVPGDSILVTITLAGGNDALNFMGPFTDGTYRDLRGSMALNASSAHFAADGQYFHPRLSRLATRFRRGDVAVIQGVGDPGLDHSHFSNLARWQSANHGGAITGTGWLGRWLDNAALNQFGGVGIGGRGVPLHMRGTTSKVTDLPSYGGGLYGSDTSEQRDRNMYRAIRRIGRGTSLGPWVDNVAANNALAIDAAQSVAPAYDQELPEGRLLPELVLSARLLNLQLGTRVLNVWQHGYDTHDNQISNNASSGDHADLLEELDIGLDRFFSILAPSVASKVVVVLYSEFGRRAEANGSRGTDHGAGGHVVLIGRSVKGGLYGEPPNLRRLDQRGDLLVQIDFRRVYATILETWLQADSRDLLGGRYRTLSVLDDGSGMLPEKDLKGRARQIRERSRDNQTNYLRYHSPRF